MIGRFAPTPSGRMHIGNVYAMLAAWLSARSCGGRIMMRIEDVDKPRVVVGADQFMMDDLHWLGLDWDGEPMFQSKRTDRYEYALKCLHSQGVLYPCFCSRADIRAASAPNEGDGFTVYPGTCRRLLREHPEQVRARLARGDRHSIRIAMPEETFAFTDGVYGPRRYDLAREVGDCVIRRADGLFGYQLAVDDIVRGRDLLRSTALQARIRRCLLEGGFEPECGGIDPCAAGRPASRSAARPAYAHLPLIDNAAGRRLAKRERSLDVGALRARGVRPEQIIGYCAWLLRLRPDPAACSPADLLSDFSWTPLRGAHGDRILDPASPHTPAWLAEAL